MYSGVAPDEDLMIKDLLPDKKINLSKVSKVDALFFVDKFVYKYLFIMYTELSFERFS
jgi:hypothetical protein